MSLVTEMEITFEPIFGEIGKEIKYVFNTLCILEDIMKNGINNVNVVVVRGDLTEESKEKLKKYHINQRAWRDEMLQYTLTQEYLHLTVWNIFKKLPEDFQKEYTAKFGNPQNQIQQMKVIL